jgi:Flp pilus assembly protein TadG
MSDIRMNSHVPRRRRTSRGSAIIETALIFPLFFVILIGAFDFGQFLFIHQAMVERARYAARWGAINNPADSTSITNVVLYFRSTTPPSGTGFLNLAASNVTVTNPDSGTANYRLTIRISGYSYRVLSPYIAGTYTGPPITVSVPLGLFN